MRKISIVSLLMIGALMFLNSNCFVAAQDKDVFEGLTEEELANIQWVWGEVVSVDPAQKALTVRYIDFDTDTEKEMILAFDDASRFENVESLDAIKPQNTVSVDFVASVDGKNLVKNLSVEILEEETAVEEQSLEETQPAAAQ